MGKTTPHVEDAGILQLGAVFPSVSYQPTLGKEAQQMDCLVNGCWNYSGQGNQGPPGLHNETGLKINMME